MYNFFPLWTNNEWQKYLCYQDAYITEYITYVQKRTLGRSTRKCASVCVFVF